MDRSSARKAHKQPDQRQQGADKVVLRRWRKGGGVIALFPEQSATADGLITSYQHMGQHGAADYQHVMGQTLPVEVVGPDRERDDLLNELRFMGYEPRLRRRRTGGNRR